MFIQTETTPNPASLKFLPGRAVLGDGTAEFRTADEAARSPLAERLFGVDGVGGVFLGSDFITVTKTDGEWQHLKPAVLGAIMEHFLSGVPALRSEADRGPGDEFFAEEDAETVATIKELIETRVRPAVAQDGGDITFQGFRDGVVYPQHARLLRRLPVVDRDAQARHREPAPPLRARGPGNPRSPGLRPARLHTPRSIRRGGFPGGRRFAFSLPFRSPRNPEPPTTSRSERVHRRRPSLHPVSFRSARGRSEARVQETGP